MTNPSPRRCSDCHQEFTPASDQNPNANTCPSCVQAIIDDQMFQDDDCGQCGGEGYTWDCIDGCCLHAEEGCDLCTRRCDWCNPPTPKQKQEAAELGQILADALNNPKR